MKKITALVLATAIAIGFVAVSNDTKTVEQAKIKSNKVMLMSEVGPGGGAG
ncbi:hypothetical protein [Bacillus sp. BB56-3]|uniref:hypothetical protein n=1 Tax=Bacillus sp. BB56-3 TaxID=2217831 RepID=UPI0015D1E179|nr:hypothetical protein [Bacillus sp. BB56-3]